MWQKTEEEVTCLMQVFLLSKFQDLNYVLVFNLGLLTNDNMNN